MSAFKIFNFGEKKIKNLAKVINSEACQKILDALTKKATTETEIAKKLNMPLSTVHYNLKQLTKAGLVKSDEFSYSVKGKEINHYTLASKYILIVPSEDTSMLDQIKEILPISVVFIAAVAIFQIIYAFLFAKGGQSTAAPMLMEAAIGGDMMVARAAPAAAESSVLMFWPYLLAGGFAFLIVFFIFRNARRK